MEVRIRREVEGVVGVDRHAAVRAARRDHRQRVAVHVAVVGEHVDAGQRRVLVGGQRAVVDGVRRPVGDLIDGDRRGRDADVAIGVGDPIVETVRTAEARVRGIGEGAVDIHGDRAVRRGRGQRPGITAVAARRVVGGQIATDRDPFVGHEAVVHGNRHTVLGHHVDGHGARADIAVAIGDGIGEAVDAEETLVRGIAEAAVGIYDNLTATGQLVDRPDVAPVGARCVVFREIAFERRARRYREGVVFGHRHAVRGTDGYEHGRRADVAIDIGHRVREAVLPREPGHRRVAEAAIGVDHSRAVLRRCAQRPDVAAVGAGYVVVGQAAAGHFTHGDRHRVIHRQR